MNNLGKKEPWYTSLLAIVIAFICFWPIGCVLLYLRWLQRYGKYKALSNLLLTLAIGLILIGMCGMIAYADSHDSEDILLALFIFIIPGGLCGFFWFKRRSKIKDYNKYIDYIKSRKKIKIDGLCNKLNVDYDTAISALTDMISKGIINGYLDDDELIIKNIENKIIEEIEEPKNSKETKIVKCKECGAKNTVVIGERKECDYCGTILQ